MLLKIFSLVLVAVLGIAPAGANDLGRQARGWAQTAQAQLAMAAATDIITAAVTAVTSGAMVAAHTLAGVMAAATPEAMVAAHTEGRAASDN